MLQLVFAMGIAILAVLAGWGAWHGHTLLLQGLVIAAGGVYVGLKRVPKLPHNGAYRGAAMFVAGAAVGALAMHGTVALLYALLWLALIAWIEHQMRSWLGELVSNALDVF
jgi:hypothetical protein